MFSWQGVVSGIAAFGFGGAIILLCRIALVSSRLKSLRYEPLDGEIAVAATPLNLEGSVRARGALHRASSLSPVMAGERVIVLQSGCPLLVKPLS